MIVFTALGIFFTGLSLILLIIKIQETVRDIVRNYKNTKLFASQYKAEQSRLLHEGGYVIKVLENRIIKLEELSSKKRRQHV